MVRVAKAKFKSALKGQELSKREKIKAKKILRKLDNPFVAREICKVLK